MKTIERTGAVGGCHPKTRASCEQTRFEQAQWRISESDVDAQRLYHTLQLRPGMACMYESVQFAAS